MGWKKATDAAWRAFGTRYWRTIVTVQAIGKALPALLAGIGAAGLVWLAWWLFELARDASADVTWSGPPAWVWLAAAGCVVLLLAGWWAARRDPYRLPWRYRRAQVARRFAAVLTLAGATVAAFVLWRG